MMKHSIGVDIGGHKLLIGLFKKKKLLQVIKVTTPKSKEQIIKEIIKIIKSFNISAEKILGIGVGCPGQIANGMIVDLPNLSGWQNTNLKKVLQKKLKVKKVFIGNDADLAAIAEKRYWKKKNLVCFTLGTGLGSGIIHNNQLLEGVELGHMTIDQKGLKCSCGANGCIEEYVSTRGVERLSKQLLKKSLSPLEVEKMARLGNKKAVKVYEEFGKSLGIGVRNAINIFNPEIIVLAGGIANAQDLFMKSTLAETKSALYKKSKIVKTKLERNSGVIGASLLVR